jgi:hypothetical protein
MRILMSLFSVLALFACENKGGETAPSSVVNGPTSEETDKNGQDDGNNAGSGSGNAGSLQLGSIELSVLPVNANAAFLTANNERNAEFASAGSLNLPSVGGALNLLDGATPRVVPTPNPYNISSGAPDELKIYITRISLKSKEGGAGSIVFDDPAGAEVYIKESGAVDISSLIASAKEQAASSEDSVSKKAGTDSDSQNSSSSGSASLRLDSDTKLETVASIGVAPGEYEEVEVTYLTRGYVKGCVSAIWGRPSGLTDDDDGEIKYCTRAGKDSFALDHGAAPFSLADFKYVANGTPEQTEVSLAKINLSKGREVGVVAQETDTIVTRYETISPIVVEADKSIPLTLMIDMNRILKFYRAGETENSIEKTPNPSYPKHGSPYFFTTVFEDSTAVFVGTPGKIMGFELIAEACLESGYNATNMTCVEDNGVVTENYCTSHNGTWNAGTATCALPKDFAVVGAWLTLIFDPENRPLFGIVQPDDDNALTVTKGSSRGFKDAAGLPNFIVPNSENASKLDIRYQMGEPDSDNRLMGFTEDFFTSVVGDEIPGISFKSGHNDGNQAGPIKLTRKL